VLGTSCCPTAAWLGVTSDVMCDAEHERATEVRWHFSRVQGGWLETTKHACKPRPPAAGTRKSTHRGGYVS
jgi:hypothetical protein